MAKMEGTLWKWTNYFSGWQPRWFILENGILSYYKSQEDVVNGCKGSIKMVVCDVNVHGTDMSRLDLIIPGEAHFYVKAASSQERQQWLVALGSAKACLTNGKPSQPTVEIPEEQIKVKKSELRLYCDLLMQQVHSVKSVAQSPDDLTIPKLNEATSLLSATCDTFINTLEECMRLSQAQTEAPMTPDTPNSTSPKKSFSAKAVPWNVGVQRSMSVDRHITTSSKSQKPKLRTNSRASSDSTEPRDDVIGDLSSLSIDGAVTTQEAVWLSKLHEVRSDLIDLDPASRVATYFTNMPVSFRDVKLAADQEIPTSILLDACRGILPIVDKLNATAFAPVKLDIDGNIKKIYQKYSTSPEDFGTLQKILDYEVTKKQCSNPNSATSALLWLKRGLEFIHHLCLQYVSGVDDLGEAATIAYGKTLKRYHSWVVRGVFGLAVKKVPTKEEFLHHLSLDVADVQKKNYEKSLLRDIDVYAVSMEPILRVINTYYKSHNLDSDEQV